MGYIYIYIHIVYTHSPFLVKPPVFICFICLPLHFWWLGNVRRRHLIGKICFFSQEPPRLAGLTIIFWVCHYWNMTTHYGVNLIIVGNQITIIMIFDYHMIKNNHILTILFLVTIWLRLVQPPFLLVKIPWLQAEKGETLFFILQTPNVGLVKTQVLPLKSLCLLLWLPMFGWSNITPWLFNSGQFPIWWFMMIMKTSDFPQLR